MLEGACLCGAVRYQIEGPFAAMMHCHCSMCRKHHGSLYATFAVAPLAGFQWLSGEDQCQAYASSEHGTRSFCRTCGSVTPMFMPPMGLVVVPAGNLLTDPEIRPQLHMFVASKAPWFELTDALPKHDGYPPEWGGGMGLVRPTASARPGVVEGSCLCGDIGFEVTGEALRAYHCHCSRCQRGRSAAHATNYQYPVDALRWTRGEAQLREYKVPEARFFTTSFCQRCGSAMPRISRERQIVVVPAGCLDVAPGAPVQAHIFVSSKAEWDTITDATPQFVEMATG